MYRHGHVLAVNAFNCANWLGTGPNALITYKSAGKSCCIGASSETSSAVAKKYRLHGCNPSTTARKRLCFTDSLWSALSITPCGEVTGVELC